VISSPCPGIKIYGDKPGTTPYTVSLVYGQMMIVDVPLGPADTPHGPATFIRWLVDGSPLPDGATDVSILADANHTLDAVYTEPTPKLTVGSTPACGIDITGTCPGRTYYTHMCQLGQAVDLLAPEGPTVNGWLYRFVRWKIGSTLQPEGQLDLHLTMTANTTVMAVYVEEFYWLTVQSSPVSGFNVAGDKPGRTEYKAACDKQQVVTLIAPESSYHLGTDYVFDRWKVDDVPQEEGATELTVTMDQGHTVVAMYIAHAKLTVRSSPSYSVEVTGDRPGTTSYSALCAKDEVVSLTAPASIDVSDTELVFACWKLDGKLQAPFQRNMQITMDADHIATMNFHLPGDISDNCSVNVLDLILLRNKLNAPVSQGNNWKADLNNDGTIDLDDLIIMTGLLGKKCP